MNFYDLPEDTKRAALDTLSRLEAEWRYIPNGIQISMPNVYQNRQAIHLYLSTFGLIESDTSYFPLGSDKPAAILRHRFQQPKTDAPGYWMYSTYQFED